jgi:hypothetical protein
MLDKKEFDASIMIVEVSMATSEEKQELVEEIKKPIRYYRISLTGHGGEIVYSQSSKEEYDYWETNIEERRRQFNIPEDESPFNRYMMDKDDIGGYEDVPAALQREDEWYDNDYIDHGTGVNFYSGYISIIECESEEYNSKELETIVDLPLEEFVDRYDAEVIIGDSDAINETYLFHGISHEKGTFFDGRLTTNSKIDLSKFRFDCTEYPNDDTLVLSVYYGDEEIDSDGGDTNGKGLYIELLG